MGCARFKLNQMLEGNPTEFLTQGSSQLGLAPHLVIRLNEVHVATFNTISYHLNLRVLVSKMAKLPNVELAVSTNSVQA